LTNFAACWTGTQGMQFGGNCFLADPPVQGPVDIV